MKISDSTSISMPMKNLISIMVAVAIGVWAYFGVIERLTMLEMENALLTKDLQQAEQRLSQDIDKNNEFRIKYPRGELGQSSQDIEQFMLIEDLYKSVEKMEEILADNMTNQVNINFLKEQVAKMLNDIEKLKDKQRQFSNGDKQ
jgi:hypothetical protein|tara:strand:- start:1648 stop:2082 length:435 start_codon:yes stop_codon:yes gene_type:complete